MSASLHTRTWGSGEPPLVLLHGWIGSTADWAEVGEALGDERRVLAYDHRGHGASPHRKDYTFASLVADLEEWADEQGLVSFDLCGHSMGGVVAMQFALKHPDRVRRLVLVDTGAEPSGALPMELIEGAAAMAREQGLAAVLQAMASPGEPSYDPPRRHEPDLTALKTMDVDAFVDFARALGDYPSFVAELASITAPTLGIVGAHDDALRPGMDAIVEAIPGATLAVLERCGHSPQQDDPDSVIALIRAHLA